MINAITGKRVIRAGKDQEGGILPFLATYVILKDLATKVVTRAGRRYNKMDQMDIRETNIKITKYLNCHPKFNGVYSIDNVPRIKDGAYVINHDDKQSKGTH